MLVSIDCSTFWSNGMFVPGCHSEVLDGSTIFEVHFDPMFLANVFFMISPRGPTCMTLPYALCFS